MAHFRHFRAGYPDGARASHAPIVLAVILLIVLATAFLLADRQGTAVSADTMLAHVVNGSDMRGGRPVAP